ncbi:MAG: glycoside hydrolase family 30 protein [Paludibacter sp.]
MMVNYFKIAFLAMFLFWGSCPSQNILMVDVYETSASGNKLHKLSGFSSSIETVSINIHPESKFQTITGFGGSFTEASAYLLNKLSRKNRNLILEAYFGTSGAKYSLTRTHINSCDFALSNYSYAPISGDKELLHFSVDEDRNDIIPMIKDAMELSEDGFKIIASPWTAPPWMKDNNKWVGGKLLPAYYDSWALFFSKYLTEYKKEGINIWGITLENEPLGNGNNWESMIYSPNEMVDFVNNHLGPKLKADGQQVKILAYDQNRGTELEDWAKVIYKDAETSKYFDGFAIHWYASTVDWFPQSLNLTHDLAPDKLIIQTEACNDAEVPHWQDDKWYWSKEATDWGWDWAPENQKIYHPKYVPVYRYARDIIGCMNNWVNGWIDWNMVLDKQGGPNWFKNWCMAPVIVDPEKDEVYFTPVYYVMAHFSKFIRPGAVRIGFENPDKELMLTAAQNTDGTIAVVILNMNSTSKNIRLIIKKRSLDVQISAQALQTIVIQPDSKSKK